MADPATVARPGTIVRRPRPLRCDLCATDNEQAKVLRFTLIRRAYQDGYPTTRAAGGINLCERCWRDTGGRRRGQGRRAE